MFVFNHALKILLFGIAVGLNCSPAAGAAIDLQLKFDPEILPVQVNKKVIGFNQGSPPLKSVDWERMLRMLERQGIRPSFIRFPGGTNANFYRWESDSYDLELLYKFDSLRTKHRETFFKEHSHDGSVGIDKIHSLSRRYEFNINYVVSVFNDSFDHVIRKLKLFHDPDDIILIELGNELYFKEQAGHRFLDPNNYADAVQSWSRTIKKHFPNALIGVCVSEHYDYNRIKKWNDALLEVGNCFDAIVLHLYVDEHIIPNRYNFSTAYNFVHYDLPMIIRYYNDFFDDKKVWITEWNIGRGNDEVISQSWYGCIFVADFITSLQQYPEVQISNYHRTIGTTHSVFTASWPKGKLSFKTSITADYFKYLSILFENVSSFNYSVSLLDSVLVSVFSSPDGYHSIQLINCGRFAVDMSLHDFNIPAIARVFTASMPLDLECRKGDSFNSVPYSSKLNLKPNSITFIISE